MAALLTAREDSCAAGTLPARETGTRILLRALLGAGVERCGGQTPAEGPGKAAALSVREIKRLRCGQTLLP